MKRRRRTVRTNRRGFTLSEIMVALTIFGLVMAGIVPVYIMCLESAKRTATELDAAQNSSLAVEKLVYGVGKQYGLRSAVGASVVVSVTGGDWNVQYRDIEGWTNSFRYDRAASNLFYRGRDTPGAVAVGRNIASAAVTNSGKGLSISVTSRVMDGRYSGSNTMATFVSFRN